MQFGVRLVDVANLDGFAQLKLSAVGLQLVHDHLENGCLTGSVRANNAHNTRRRQIKIQVFVE